MANYYGYTRRQSDYENLYNEVIRLDDSGMSYDDIAKKTGLLRFQVIGMVQTEFGRRKLRRQQSNNNYQKEAAR